MRLSTQIKSFGAVVALSLPIAGVALADEPPTADEPQAAQEQTAQATGKAMSPQPASTDIVGRKVVDTAGKRIGEVDSLVVSKADRSVFAVVSVGEFLGLGGKDVAIPLDRLSIGGEDAILMSQEAETTLEAMPAYDPEAYEPYTQGKPEKDRNYR